MDPLLLALTLNTTECDAAVPAPCPLVWSRPAVEQQRRHELWLKLELPDAAYEQRLEEERQRAAPMSFIVADRVVVGFDVAFVPASLSVEIEAPFGDDDDDE